MTIHLGISHQVTSPSPQHELDQVLHELESFEHKLVVLTEEHHTLQRISQPSYAVRRRMDELTLERRALYLTCLDLERRADDLGHVFKD